MATTYSSTLSGILVASLWHRRYSAAELFWALFRRPGESPRLFCIGLTDEEWVAFERALAER